MSRRERGRYPIVTPEVSAGGYELAVRNASRLLDAGVALLAQFPSVALGLAQLGQEEVGKSLSLLAAIGLRPVPDAWEWFWREWRDHQVKAHRAYLYELLDPQRIEIRGQNGRVYDGLPLRRRIVEEKEAAFYVDFDAERQSFIAPAEAVAEIEALSRLSTLGYLGLTASVVHDVLVAEDSQFRLTAFSEIAFRMCTEELFQEDMPAILDEFGQRSARHRQLVDALTRGFAANRLRTTTSREEGT